MKIESVEDYKKVKNLLIVIDMVNGFVREGALAAPSIARIIPHNVEMIQKFLKDSESAVIFIRDSHTPDAVEFKTFLPHCISGTEETL